MLLSFIHNELLKVWKSIVFWVVAVVFIAMPLLIGLFKEPGVSWDMYYTDIFDSIASLLVVGFSFTSAWVFGREYTDKTIKDLIVKPIPKSYSVLSKFIVITIWNILIALFTFALITIAGSFIGVNGSSGSSILQFFGTFMLTSVLIMAVSSTSALIANITKGYLAPIGLIFVIIIASNAVVQLGLGPYFPWTIPVLLTKGVDIGFISYSILVLTAIVGFAGTVAWWRFAEHK
ncbi:MULTISPECIES: ABC transporter permease [Paenibacillus]|jgi:ABC-2 type transport system permease protein|uniref:ABC-2 type transport system permease protein n=1 Tax=Paenibacillus barengoltzii J12 TaxID=935846 RepID=A0ABY1M156_9BACL|nr:MULTISPECIES: ABC transporter permease [Paenibacillus]SMF52991.1 ABC-2 type transport system permease protein [Paenibacillus barengoltzii J12]SMF57606.1 ABC-2 type transport system permease protein [Paenibacillus barengoltzii]